MQFGNDSLRGTTVGYLLIKVSGNLHNAALSASVRTCVFQNMHDFVKSLFSGYVLANECRMYLISGRDAVLQLPSSLHNKQTFPAPCLRLLLQLQQHLYLRIMSRHYDLCLHALAVSMEFLNTTNLWNRNSVLKLRIMFSPVTRYSFHMRVSAR